MSSAELGARLLGSLRPNELKQVAPAEDILRGAGQIAIFLLGDAKERRKIYYLAEIGSIPVFRLGTIICARKSTILAWLSKQERGDT
jgi:hypothetical protein